MTPPANDAEMQAGNIMDSPTGRAREERGFFFDAMGRRLRTQSAQQPNEAFAGCTVLAALCDGRTRYAATALVVTIGRTVRDQERAAGYIAKREASDATLVTDMCWYMLGEPVIPPTARTFMSSSANMPIMRPASSTRGALRQLGRLGGGSLRRRTPPGCAAMADRG